MVATIENWGGGGALAARVRTVEPAAFTKVSALGVEEQRVNVVLDLADPPRALGDGFRVDVRILEAEAPAALKVPGSAVFRAGPGDAVFVVLGGRAKLQPVDIGLRNRDEVEIRAGVDPGAQVVRFPSSALADGVRVREAR
jgi:HlyD family secretion protein